MSVGSSYVGWLVDLGLRIALCTALIAATGAPYAQSMPEAKANLPARPRPPVEAPLSALASLTQGRNAAVLDRGSRAQMRNAAIPLASAPGRAMQPFSAIKRTSADFRTALKCLTQAVYYEAAKESLAGQRGVAQVVLNRVRHPAYPDSVCGVVYEGWNQPVCQFSFVCDGSLRRRPAARQWHEAQGVARRALSGYVDAQVGTATHYHADYVVPRWAYALAKVRQVGTHLFYRFAGRGGREASFTEHWDGSESIPHIDMEHLPLAAASANEADTARSEPGYRIDRTDRRADDDVGGRMDPSKGWKLTIPGPGTASGAYRAALRQQREGGETS